MRILGVDLGSSSIKAVELDSAFGRFEIHDYHEQPYSEGSSAASPAKDLAALFASLPKTPDRVAIALKTGQVTFRNLRLPTRDKKSIQSGVAFELEDELPFPADQAIHDFAILSQSRQSGTFLHVAATLKKNVSQALDKWAQSGVEPDQLTTEAWAYRSFLNRMLLEQSQEKPILLVQIGHERTTLYIQHHGNSVMAREVLWGGSSFNLAICQKKGVPLAAAEKIKLDQGILLSAEQAASSTPEQKEMSEILSGPFELLISEIRQAALTSKNLTHDDLETIYLAGGTSQLPGLIQAVEEHARIPAQALRALSSVGNSGVTYSEETDATFLLAASLALSQAGQSKASSINFRQGIFAKKGKSRELNWTSLKRPLQATAAVAASLFISLIVQSFVYKARMKEMDAQLEKSVRSFFVQIAPSAVRSYLNNTSSLRNAINKEITKQRELAKLLGPNPKSPLDFLKEASVAVSKDVVVDVAAFQVGAAPQASYLANEDQTASLTFLVANPQMAEKMANIFQSKLTNMQRSKIEEVGTPDGKKWKMTLSGKPTEDAYGK